MDTLLTLIQIKMTALYKWNLLLIVMGILIVAGRNMTRHVPVVCYSDINWCPPPVRGSLTDWRTRSEPPGQPRADTNNIATLRSKEHRDNTDFSNFLMYIFESCLVVPRGSCHLGISQLEL